MGAKMHYAEESRLGFWNKIEFLYSVPRIGRIKFLGMFSTWLGILFLTTIFPEKIYLDGYIFMFLFILIAPNLIGLQMRRMHDLNRSAWWLLLNVIPGVSLLIFLVLGCCPGTKGANRFGTASYGSKVHYLMILTTPFLLCVSAVFRS